MARKLLFCVCYLFLSTNLRKFKSLESLFRSDKMALVRKSLWGPLIFILLFFAWSYTEQSSSRIFWNDEGLELADTCNISHTTLITKGAIVQASPSPLHYNLQKIIYPAFTEMGFSSFVSARLISIWSIITCAFFVFLFLWKMGSSEGAFLAVAALFSPLLMADFATQTRPYQLWNLLFALSLVVAVWNPDGLWKNWKHFVLWVLCCFALTMVSLVGFVQASAILFGAVVVYFWEKRNFPKRLIFLLASQVVFMGLTFLYAQVRDADPDSDTFQFFTKQGTQWDLLKGIVRLYLPKDDIPFNLMAVFGLLYPIWGKVRNFKHLGILLWLQLVSVGMITALVLWQNYFLIQRLFLNLIVCRSFFIALGFVLLLEVLPNFLPFQRKVGPVVMGLVRVGGLILALYSLSVSGMASWWRGIAMKESFVEFIQKEKAKVNCSEFNGNRAQIILDPGLEQLWGVYPNSIEYFSRITELCGGSAGKKLDSWIYVKSAQTYGNDPMPKEFRVLREKPKSGIELKVCGSKPNLEW